MSNKMKIYISGPMSGIEDFNIKVFDKASDDMREIGYDVHNPADYAKEWIKKNGNRDMTPDEYNAVMLDSLNALKTCDAILMLPKWQYSKGAKNELMLALVRNMDVKIYGKDLNN